MPVILFAALPAGAAGVFYSFDTSADGTESYTSNPTVEIGLAGPSSFEVNGSVLSTSSSGGWTSLASQNLSGVTWMGNGGTGTPGHSATINPSSTGNSYSLTLPTTGLSEMAISFDYRYAGITGSGAFTSFTYSINGGAPVEVPGATLSLSASSPSTAFNTWSVDLTELTEIEDQDSVTFTWNLPNFGGGNSFRMDNLQLTAVPEPGVTLLAGLAAAFMAGYRRKAM